MTGSGESERVQIVSRVARLARLLVRAPAVLAIAGCVALVAGWPAGAQELPGAPGRSEQAPDAADPTRPEAIASRRSAVAAEIEAAERAISETPKEPTRAHLETLRERLREIDGLLEQQADLATPGPSSVLPAPPTEADSPSPFALNALYEARFEAEEGQSRRVEALAASRAALATAKEKLEEAERKRRETQRELEGAEEPSAKRKAERALQLRQLASRAAQERVHLRTLETRLAQRAREEDTGIAELEDRIVRMREALARGEGASSPGFAALTEREGELRRSREAVERSLSTTELRLEAAHKRFSQQSDPSPELLEEVEALTAWRDAIRQEITLLDAQLERLATQRTVWQQWESVLGQKGKREEFEAWQEEVGERIEALEQLELERRGRAAALQRRLDTLQDRLANLPESARARPAFEAQRATLLRLLAAQLGEATELAADRRLSERLRTELWERTGQLDPWEYSARGAQALRDTWSYEITAVDDAPITVGSLVLALFIAALGLWASRRGSASVGRIATDRFKLDAGAAHALQTMCFYALLVSFTLLALRAIHFPLTAFTVLGGALAIGIGFGSQNVMNNFISGLILMLERPVRARDVVEVDGNHGTIEHIGARSTKIRATDGRHLVVPNSFFLESNLVNWTLSDELVRAKVSVGVIYGSPTRLVEELIRRVVQEDAQILKTPEPIIVFEEFGDNSLNFDVYFWVKARSPMEMRKVQSGVRFAIDDLFREHDLVIAFPQRDVHLDSVSPLEVRLLGGAAPVAPAKGSDPEAT